MYSESILVPLKTPIKVDNTRWPVKTVLFIYFYVSHPTSRGLNRKSFLNEIGSKWYRQKWMNKHEVKRNRFLNFSKINISFYENF